MTDRRTATPAAHPEAALPTDPRPADPPPADPVRGGAGARSCRCGHERELHEHYRRGTDCASCDCERFRARTSNPVAAVVAAVRRRRTPDEG